jgi:DNA-binding transcriptional LysR family regulator
MQPLDGLYYFTQVVEHGGFARAARVLGIPKSRVSRHVVALEATLNVRLVNRSTRRFVVTDVGHEVYRHATAMLAEADAALEAVEFARAAPRGIIKVSCPVALAQTPLASLLPDFLAKHPAVRLQLHVSNRRVDVLSEGFDVALRVRSQPTGEDGLVMRSFGELAEVLVASPGYLERAGEITEPSQLAQLEELEYAGEFHRHPWELVGPDAKVVHGEPRQRVQLCLVITGPVVHGRRRVTGGWYLPPRAENQSNYRYACFGGAARGRAGRLRGRTSARDGAARGSEARHALARAAGMEQPPGRVARGVSHSPGSTAGGAGVHRFSGGAIAGVDVTAPAQAETVGSMSKG